MAVMTAREWKDAESPELIIDVGGGREVRARRPDIGLLVLKGLMPTPLLAEVVKIIGAWTGTALTELSEDLAEKNDKVLEFLDTYVCAACVQPRVVATQEELEALGGEALLVTDLTVATKRLIVVRCTQQVQAATTEVVAAAKEFPQVGSSEGARPDVSEVSPAPV